MIYTLLRLNRHYRPRVKFIKDEVHRHLGSQSEFSEDARMVAIASEIPLSEFLSEDDENLKGSVWRLISKIIGRVPSGAKIRNVTVTCTPNRSFESVRIITWIL